MSETIRTLSYFSYILFVYRIVFYVQMSNSSIHKRFKWAKKQFHLKTLDWYIVYRPPRQPTGWSKIANLWLDPRADVQGNIYIYHYWILYMHIKLLFIFHWQVSSVIFNIALILETLCVSYLAEVHSRIYKKRNEKKKKKQYKNIKLKYRDNKFFKCYDLKQGAK